MKNKILFLLVTVAILSSCVTSKRCSRKFPPQIHTETIIRDTTIITETTRFDTIFNSSKDTVFLYNPETKIKIKYLQLPGDSIFVAAECPSDTITVTTERITNNVIHEERGPGGFFWIFLIISISGLLFGGAYLIRQIKK